jgi:hypothetical protein
MSVLGDLLQGREETGLKVGVGLAVAALNLAQIGDGDACDRSKFD